MFNSNLGRTADLCNSGILGSYEAFLSRKSSHREHNIEATEDFGVFKVRTEHLTALSIFQISLARNIANSHIFKELAWISNRGHVPLVERKADRGLEKNGRLGGAIRRSLGSGEKRKRKSCKCCVLRGIGRK